MCKIEFNFDEPSHVTVKIVDVMGMLVQTLLDDNKPAGHYDLDFNDEKLNAGRYYYKVFTEPAETAENNRCPSPSGRGWGGVRLNRQAC